MLLDKSSDFIIKKLSAKSDILETFLIITQHHPHIKKEDFVIYVDEIIAENNYQMIAVLNKSGKIIAIAGYWILTRFYSGKYVQVGNMVVDIEYRCLGIGKKMLNFIENEGKKLGCKHFILDARLDNEKSHNLYLREGFEIIGYHFIKNIK